MCIIILNKKGVLDKQIIQNCWDANSHGSGIAWSDEGEMKTYKNLTNVEQYYTKYLKLRSSTDKPLMLHFRISTGGKKDEANCHPFLINRNIAFCHNGTISHMPKDDNYCDTVLFNKTVLKTLPVNFLDQEVYQMLIEKFIGLSKLCFLDINGNYKIYNEEKGHWDVNKDNWYSNDSYKTKSYKGYGSYNGKNNYNDKIPYGGWNKPAFDKNNDVKCRKCGRIIVDNYYDYDICDDCLAVGSDYYTSYYKGYDY